MKINIKQILEEFQDSEGIITTYINRALENNPSIEEQEDLLLEIYTEAKKSVEFGEVKINTKSFLCKIETKLNSLYKITEHMQKYHVPEVQYRASSQQESTSLPRYDVKDHEVIPIVPPTSPMIH